MVTPVERRRQVTHGGIASVNWQQEEPTDSDGRRQPSRSGTSRISRETYVRFCERLEVKFPGPTRRSGNGILRCYRARSRLYVRLNAGCRLFKPQTVLLRWRGLRGLRDSGEARHYEGMS